MRWGILAGAVLGVCAAMLGALGVLVWFIGVAIGVLWLNPLGAFSGADRRRLTEILLCCLGCFLVIRFAPPAVRTGAAAILCLAAAVLSAVHILDKKRLKFHPEIYVFQDEIPGFHGGISGLKSLNCNDISQETGKIVDISRYRTGEGGGK